MDEVEKAVYVVLNGDLLRIPLPVERPTTRAGDLASTRRESHGEAPASRAPESPGDLWPWSGRVTPPFSPRFRVIFA